MYLKCCVLFSVLAFGSTNRLNKLLIKRSAPDLDNSGTGYYYHSADGGPAHLVYLDNSNENGHYSGELSPYVQGGPAAHSYVISHVGGPEFIETVEPPHFASYVAEAPHEEIIVQPQAVFIPNGHHGENGGPQLARYSSEGHHGGSAENYKNGGDGHHHDVAYASDHGSSYDEAGHSKHGEKGNKGYDKEHKFSKGEKGHHAKENHSGYYDKHGAKKASEYDEAAKYGSHHAAEKGSKGGKFGEKKHHKKGSKTTGYHNVFHKDEYKKDHTFYDDVDHKGNFEKHGSDNKHHKSNAGKWNKGGHHKSAYDQGHKGNKGDYNKGHYDNEDKGYKNKHNHEGYYAHADEFGKKGGSSDGHEHGYKSKGHGYGHY